MHDDSPAFLSVVLVAYNSASVLPETVRSLRTHLPDAEIVVVDNGSTDDTVAVAERGGARVVSGHGNVGFGAGVNIGVASATRPYVLVLNPDAPIGDADHEALNAACGRVPFGVLAAYERDGEETHALLRASYPWRAELLWSLAAWFLVPAELELPKPRWPRRGDRFSGAAFIVARDEFLELGGFDERLFLYHEDEELSERYSAAALPVRASDALIVEHEQGTSSPRNHELILAWQLLSFVQHVAGRDGPREATIAATWIRRGLHAIVALGSALRRVPVVGGRAADKSASALKLIEALRQQAATPPRGTTYPDAAPLVRAAFER